MKEVRELLRLAREMVAGVSVSISGFNPLNMSEILYNYVTEPVAKAMGPAWDMTKATYDGGTSPSGFTGTLNIYIDNDDQMAKVLQALRGVFRDLEERGVKVAIKKDKSRMTDGDVIRFTVRANSEAKYEKMGQTELHMTVTTWSQMLNAAGLQGVNAMAGSASVREMERAFDSAKTSDMKLSRYIDIIKNIIDVAKKLGYKELFWG